MRTPGASLTVDLPAQELVDPDGTRIPFAIDPFKKECLIAGLDDVALTMQHRGGIDAFEATDTAARPWVVPARPNAA